MKKIKKNVGDIDRWVRITIGILLLSLLNTNLEFRNIGYIGIILIITGLLRFCPIYSLFKFNTNTKK